MFAVIISNLKAKKASKAIMPHEVELPLPLYPSNQ